jgi:hypothetical protein
MLPLLRSVNQCKFLSQFDDAWNIEITFEENNRKWKMESGEWEKRRKGGK